tara:strand:- start:95 stop:295 length:201 start_codon:yes stop_codon:yes gene_type:complete
MHYKFNNFYLQRKNFKEAEHRANESMAMEVPKYQTPKQESYRVKPLPEVEEDFIYKVPNTDRIRPM